MKRYPQISNIIIGATHRAGHTGKSLSKAAGIPYPTFRRRLSDPGSWRLYELKAISHYVDFDPSDKEIIGKEVGFV